MSPPRWPLVSPAQRGAVVVAAVAAVAAVLGAGCTRGEERGIGTACHPVTDPCRAFLACEEGRCARRRRDAAVDDAVPAPRADAAWPGDVDDETSVDEPSACGARPWPGAAAVPICWESPPPPDVEAMVVELAQEVWARATRLRVVFEGACRADPAQTVDRIALALSPGASPTAHLGPRPGAATRVRLDPASPTATGDALYALGRALGLCVRLQRGRLEPSWRQIVAAQRAYGLKDPGALVGASNRCLSLPEPRDPPAPPDPARLLPCGGADPGRQRWSYDPAGALSALPGLDPICLEADLQGSAPLVPVTCHGADAERQRLRGVEWRGLGGLCAHPLAGAPEEGTRVGLGACAGGRRTVWSLERKLAIDGGIRLHLPGTALCAGHPPPGGGSRGADAEARLVPCTDPRALLAVDAGGGIRAVERPAGATPPRCLAADEARPEAPLRWGACPSGAAPLPGRFWLRGKLMDKDEARCLRAPGPEGEGTSVTFTPCAARLEPEEVWDYYLYERSRAPL